MKYTGECEYRLEAVKELTEGNEEHRRAKTTNSSRNFCNQRKEEEQEKFQMEGGWWVNLLNFDVLKIK